MLNLQDITFSYGTKKVLSQLSLSVKPNQIAALIGPSGIGKTTLFKLIAGIIQPDAGEIKVAGIESTQRAEKISYMMQEDLLLPWRTVLGNLTLTAELGSSSRDLSHLQDEARKLLEEVGLPNTEDLLPDELSGGMRKRVGLARALLEHHPLLLLDEPFSSLDTKTRGQMFELLKALQRHYQKTIFLITHDFRDALLLSDVVFLLSEGQIKEQWEVPEEVLTDPHVMGEYHQILRQALA